jgi:hypothetical protein
MDSFIGIILTVALVSIGSTALAVDNDRISQSASDCYHWGSGSPGRWNNGAIGNLATGGVMRVMCPVTRIAHADNFRISVYVLDDNPNWDYDRNRSADVFCSVYDNNLYGDSWHWSGWRGTGGHTNGTSVTFSDGNMRHHTAGALHLLCDIPWDPTNGGPTKIVGYTSQRQ